MSQVFRVTARLNDRCQPEFRGALYEDPLNEALDARGFGSVEGGGTQLGPNGEISHCEVEIALSSQEPGVTDFLITHLNRLGAPKGSRLLLPDGSEIAFGESEGMAVYLNGTDLPQRVYAECDINVVIEELLKSFGESAKLHGYFEGDTETALYFYGSSFEAMVDLSQNFRGSYALCQRARVERIA